MRIGGEGATNGATIGYDRGFCFPLCLVNPFVMKPLRQQNRPVISYVPRVEPAPPEHAVKMDHFRDVWILRGKYVAFLLMGSISVAHRHSACRSRRSAGLTRCVRKVRLKPESAAEIKPLNDQRFFLCLPFSDAPVRLLPRYRRSTCRSGAATGWSASRRSLSR